MEVWAESVGLTPDTLRILQEEGLTKISQVGLLTPEEIDEAFKKTKRLPLVQCLALQQAATQLRTSSSPAMEATAHDLEQGDCLDLESLRSAVPHPEQATAGLSQLTHQSDCNTDGNILFKHDFEIRLCSVVQFHII